jgi:hypothetical protein
MPVFSIPVAMTAAEIAAAEALAATIAAEAAAAAAAAETAAAITASEIAAAEAASQLAAQEIAAAEVAKAAAVETAKVAVPEVASAVPEAAGILEASASAVPPPTTPLPPAGLEQAPIAGSTPPPIAEPLAPAGSTPPPVNEIVNAAPQPSGLEQINPALEQINPAQELSQAEIDAFKEGLAEGNASGTSPYEPTASNNGTQLVEKAAQPPTTGPETYADMPGEAEGVLDTSTGPRQVGEGIPLQTPAEAAYNAPFEPASMPPGNPFLDGLKSVGSYMDANPIKTGAALFLGANALGMFDQNSASRSGGPGTEKETYVNKNPLSADFNRNRPTPNVYKPRTYQEGGITQASRQNNDTEGDISGDVPRYYRGELATSRGQKGNVYGATQRFLDMYDPARRYTPPEGASNPNVGIFRDSNPSTANKSALEAADIRRKAIENRAYVKTGANYMPPSREMGELDFTIIGDTDKKKRSSESDSVLAAKGGIMQANLGGYAAGGNPRLLSGPGDGMSDNIPAMIGNKQPARLADGEFVVPADVVSHLGNGSTDAGAKRLHEMMNQVRMDRTGKKKQAPAVKAKKYIPK